MAELKSRHEIREQLKEAQKDGWNIKVDKEKTADILPKLYSFGKNELRSTTNICISNLPSLLNENALLVEFGKFGPIASIKIMWPWSDDQRARGHNVAFVAFTTRQHAENAMMAVQGTMIEGKCLRMSWGKPLQINSQPMRTNYEYSNLKKNPLGHENLNTIPPFSANQVQSVQTSEEFCPLSFFTEIKIPKKQRLRILIDRFADAVARNGPKIEKLIGYREYNNEDFKFARILLNTNIIDRDSSLCCGKNVVQFFIRTKSSHLAIQYRGKKDKYLKSKELVLLRCY
jgi:U2-associated protein SR140